MVRVRADGSWLALLARGKVNKGQLTLWTRCTQGGMTAMVSNVAFPVLTCCCVAYPCRVGVSV